MVQQLPINSPSFFMHSKHQKVCEFKVNLLVRFGFFFFDKNWFKSVWFGFFGLVRFFFPVWIQFGSVRFFQFQAYKIETKPVGFFKILIGFFSRFGFFSYFFFSFLGLIDFFLTPTTFNKIWVKTFSGWEDKSHQKENAYNLINHSSWL
jgi:hypothetical protein